MFFPLVILTSYLQKRSRCCYTLKITSNLKCLWSEIPINICPWNSAFRAPCWVGISYPGCQSWPPHAGRASVPIPAFPMRPCLCARVSRADLGSTLFLV